ncbi:NADPH oxidase organizer 1 [Sceloporus undulatus]|uniref:NADPH oxidase organizer 1 n=1 Tax=Sceloporus undulatus TaxID=8520 RepID=UPI001C4B8139|nr:NADPH oxidase organizer 1 [Sceloporus undulatus]
MSICRFPVDVKAMGLLEHDAKEKICMFSVSWSDQNLVLVYRAFEEFKKLHKTLKRKFPIERGLLRSSDRTIPKFPDFLKLEAVNDRLRRISCKGTTSSGGFLSPVVPLKAVNAILWKNQKQSRCLKILKQLEIYCQDLLRTQPQISQGEDVIHFFEAQSQDMDSSFAENSNITFPSEMGNGKQAAPVWPSMLTITEPIVSPIYTCIEAFETTDTKIGAFQALRGESLEVLMKDRTGWWLVENNRKQLAWFPASYLEETEEGPIAEGTKEEGMLYYLTESYEAQEADELSVKPGVLVEVLEKLDSGWWLVWYNGKRGYIPSVFLQPYRNPHHKFLALASHGLCVSSPNLLDVPGLSSETSSAQEKQCHGGKAALWGRAQSCFLGPAAATASSFLATEGENLSDILGSLSKQESHWLPKAKVRRVGSVLPTEIPQKTPGCQGHPSPNLGKKPWDNPGFDKKPVGSLHPFYGSPLAPAQYSPPVPPRPSPHEILQKCTTVTKRTIQMAKPRTNPTACK